MRLMRIGGCVVAMTALAVGCNEQPTAVDDAGAPSFKKNGKGGHAADVPVVIGSFTGGLLPGAGSPAMRAGDVLSDGRLWVVTTEPMCVDFTQGLVVQSEQDWADFVKLSDQNPLEPVCSNNITLHTRDHSNDGKMLGQVPGVIEYAGGKVVFNDDAFKSHRKNSWEWRVIFDTRAGHGTTPVGEGVCITLRDDAPKREWLVENGCTPTNGPELIDDVVEFWRVTARQGRIPGKSVLVATFTMPFSFVVIEQ